MALSARDYRRILGIIEIIYAIPDRATMFRTVCDELQKLIPFPSAVLIAADPKNGAFHFPGSHTYNCSVEGLKSFCSYYAPLQPLVASGTHLSLTHAVRLTDVIPPCLLAGTEYSTDFQAANHIFYEMCINLNASDGMISGIGVHRARKDRDFAARDLEIVNLLIPHLTRAFQYIDILQKGIMQDENLSTRLSGLELSVRQQEVAFLVMKGSTNRQIARRLYISEQTVKDHLFDIFEKMKVRRRAELTAAVLGIREDNRRPVFH